MCEVYSSVQQILDSCLRFRPDERPSLTDLVLNLQELRALLSAVANEAVAEVASFRSGWLTSGESKGGGTPSGKTAMRARQLWGAKPAGAHERAHV